MQITTIQKEEYSIIKLEEEKVLGTEAEELQAALLKQLDEEKKFIIVDLSAVNFISSWGIGMLIHGLTTSKNRDAQLVLAGVSDKILDVLKGVKLDTVIEIYDSVDDVIDKN